MATENALAPPKLQKKKKNSKATRKKARQPLPRRMYRVTEIAEMLGCHISTVYDAIKLGQLRYRRYPGGMIGVPDSAFEEYLNERPS